MKNKSTLSSHQPAFRGNNNKKHFSVSVRLETNEIFPVNSITSEMKIKELKSHIEFHCGVPYHLQRLHYLDEADLMESTDVRHNDIVPGALLKCDVWPMWGDLLEAVAADDVEWVFRLGVTQDTTYRTPHSDYMTLKSRRAWIADRAVVALMMAVHRGHVDLVERLIDAGADVNGKTPLGRTPLHIAAGRGLGKVVKLLLQKGADLDETDNEGRTASYYASRFGHKDCERQLFLFQWQQRAANMKPEFQNLPRMAHQYYDSKFPVWMTGDQIQLYYTKITPPGEYEGTAFHSPKRRHRPSTAPNKREISSPPERMTSEIDADESVHESSSRRSRGGKRDFVNTIIRKAKKDAMLKSRPLSRDLNDSDRYGLVRIDDRDKVEERIRNSAYGRGLAYSRHYSSRQPTNPQNFEDWMRSKSFEKRMKEQERLENEMEERREAERKRIAQLDKLRGIENSLMDAGYKDRRPSTRAVIDKIRSAAREGRRLTSHDLWLMKKEMQTEPEKPRPHRNTLSP